MIYILQTTGRINRTIKRMKNNLIKGCNTCTEPIKNNILFKKVIKMKKRRK